MVLDNIALFASLDSNMEDYISDVNDPEETYNGSGTLLYTVTFEFDIEIQEPTSEYADELKQTSQVINTTNQTRGEIYIH